MVTCGNETPTRSLFCSLPFLSRKIARRAKSLPGLDGLFDNADFSSIHICPNLVFLAIDIEDYLISLNERHCTHLFGPGEPQASIWPDLLCNLSGHYKIGGHVRLRSHIELNTKQPYLRLTEELQWQMEQ